MTKVEGTEFKKRSNKGRLGRHFGTLNSHVAVSIDTFEGQKG